MLMADKSQPLVVALVVHNDPVVHIHSLAMEQLVRTKLQEHIEVVLLLVGFLLSCVHYPNLLALDHYNHNKNNNLELVGNNINVKAPNSKPTNRIQTTYANTIVEALFGLVLVKAIEDHPGIIVEQLYASFPDYKNNKRIVFVLSKSICWTKMVSYFMYHLFFAVSVDA